MIVVGAGAAGLATAIFAGRSRRNTRIVLLDGARKVGAKILVAGGGRCNVTNAAVRPDDFYGGNRNILKRVLRTFPASAARSFFEEIGVALHEEEHGKLFPDSNSARTVLAALLQEVERCGGAVHAGHRVSAIERDGNHFQVRADTESGERNWQTARVVLATGGRSLPRTGSDGFGYTLAERLGHSIVPTTPALDPLVLEDALHEPLSGVSHEVQLTVHVAGAKPVSVSGSMLWTHFGISGPVALNCSRFWNRARLDGQTVTIHANFARQPFEQVEKRLLEATEREPRARVPAVVREWLPTRVAEALCRFAEIPLELEFARLDRASRRRLAHALTAWPVPVRATRGYRYAEVTAGGVPLREVDPATMESRVSPGLHLVGEILDVDGRIGGFNFQWAWSSGFVAGNALGAAL